MTVTVVTEGGTESVSPEVVQETVGEAAVEIAQIQADRDIALAEISAEVITDQNETAIELAEEEEDLEQWLDVRLLALESRVITEMMSLQEQMTRLETMLTGLLILIPPSTPAEITPELAPEIPENVVDVAAPVEAETRVRARNWL